MRSVELLAAEHQTIDRMLNVLDACASRMARGAPVPGAMLEGIVEFLEVYADAGHHAKEEDLFFPALASHGIEPQTSPIHALRVQHDSGRALVREMRETLGAAAGGDGSAARAFAATARDYIALLREHMRIEDIYFVEYARECFSAEEDAALRARMDEVDRARAGGDRYRNRVGEYEEAQRTW